MKLVVMKTATAPLVNAQLLARSSRWRHHVVADAWLGVRALLRRTSPSYNYFGVPISTLGLVIGARPLADPDRQSARRSRLRTCSRSRRAQTRPEPRGPDRDPPDRCR